MPLRDSVVRACACVLLLVSMPGPLWAQDGDFRVTLATDVTPNLDPTAGSYNHHVAEVAGVLYASFLYTDRATGFSYIWIKSSADGGHVWTDFFTPWRAGGGARLNNQPAVIAADGDGRLHVAWCGATDKYGNYMVFAPDSSGSGALNPQPALWRTDVGKCNTKFCLVYNEVDDCMHWSRRDFSGNMEVYTLFLSGPDTDLQLSWQSHSVVSSVGTCATDYWDAQYQSLSVDPFGRLHMIYNPHHWPTGCSGSYERVAVLYLWSDDLGATWHRADGSPVTTPFPANDFTAGGTMISGIGSRYWGASINSDYNNVYVAYVDESTEFVAFHRESGGDVLEIPYFWPVAQSVHSSVVLDRHDGTIYVVADGTQTYYWVDGEKQWRSQSVDNDLNDPPPDGHNYQSASTLPRPSSLGFIVSVLTDRWSDDFGDHTDVIAESLSTDRYRHYDSMIAYDASGHSGTVIPLGVAHTPAKGTQIDYFLVAAGPPRVFPSCPGLTDGIGRLALYLGSAVASEEQTATLQFAQTNIGFRNSSTWNYVAIAQAECQLSNVAEVFIHRW